MRDDFGVRRRWRFCREIIPLVWVGVVIVEFFAAVDEGLRPHSKLIRDGLHIVPWQWAFVKSMPRAASRSMFGVRVCE